MVELVQLQSYVIPTKTATKCVLACAYKAAEVVSLFYLFIKTEHRTFLITGVALGVVDCVPP